MADKPTKLKNKETAFRSNEELIKQVEARIKNGNKVNQEDGMKYVKAKGLKKQDLLDFYDNNMSQGFLMKNPSKLEREEIDPNYKVPTTDADIKNWRKYNTGVESMKADSVPSQLKQYLINTGFSESNKFGSGDTLEGKRILTRAKSVGINPEIDAEGNFKLADDVNTFKDTDKTFGKTRTINPKAKYVKKVYTKGNDIVNNYELAVPPTYEGKVPSEQELKDFDSGNFYQVGATSNMRKVYVPYLDPKKIPQDSDASTINANNQEMVNRYNTVQSYADQIAEYKKTDEYKNTQKRRAAVAPIKKAFNDIKNYEFKIMSDKDLDALENGGTITTPREDMFANGGMIKRADGSYSKRGLWDNIRANKGSGKAPTKEMLKQERKINAKYEEGGTTGNDAGNRGMMKARMALDAHFGNPSAQRMVSPNPKTGMTPEGIGTHYMASMGNYAVPLLQDKGGNDLEYNYNPAPSREDMRFESPENAQYFAENYKNIAPMMRSNKFAKGGKVPIVVNNPNDPRLRAYNDSNTLYGVTSLAKKFLATKPTMEQWIDYANNDNVDVTKAWNKLKKINNKYPEPIKKEPVFLKSTTTGEKEEGALNYYKKPVQPYVYEKSKPIIEQNVPQPAVNQEPDFQPDMVQLNNNPNYDKTKLYQGYDFMQQTGLRPGDYTETQVQEAMKNKGLPKKSLGGRVLPKFGKGSTYRGGGDSLPVPPGTPPSSVQGNIGTGAGIAASVVPMLTSFIPDDKITDSEGNEIGSEQSVGKGALEGAAKGAQVTAMLGGADFGASIAIGAGIGAVQTELGNDDVRRERDQANMRIGNRKMSNSVLTNKNMFSTNTSNNDQMIAAKGGTVVNEDMGNPNAELELNETFRDPMTGETGMVDGPSHDNGGIEMSLAEGTQIWSDRLKHNGKTFASLTKPIINKIANIEKGLDTNPNSRFKQNSIKLLNAQLDFFFDKQESNKQQDEMKRTLKKQEGGVVDDMGNYHYANGGIYIKPENRNKMAMGGNVLPKFYEAGTFNSNGDPVLKLSGVNTNSFNSAFNNRGMYKKDAVSNYRDNQNADLAEVNNTLGAEMNQMNMNSRNTMPIATNTVPVNTQEAANEMVNSNSAPLNNFDAQNYRKFMGNFKGDLKNIQGHKMGFGQPNENSWDNKGYTLGTNGAAGDQYTFDKIGTPTYQEPEAQPENKSQWYRRNNGELIQAGALAGSTFAQLNNINKQAAPGIRPDVRLTGAIPNPRYVDLSAERGAINRSALGAMGNRDFGNSATAQAFKNKARINQLQGLGQSFSNQEIANADIGNKFAGMRGDAAMKEAMMNNEIANTNLENKYQFNQNRMANQNAAIGVLGHGVGDIGRNRTMFSNDMEKASVLSNQYEDSVLADTYKRNPQLLEDAWNSGQISKNKYDKYKNPTQAKYGGTVKTRSLKY